MKPEPSPWARQLRAARKSAGLSQRQVAERVGISQPLVAYVEGGYVPTPKLQQRLVKAVAR